MYLERAVLELQAGVLLPANYPRLATEGIAAGRDGEILRAMNALLGERQVRVLEVVSDIPDIEKRLLEELRVPDRSRAAAASELASVIAADTLSGALSPWEGAGELTAFARTFDDPTLTDDVALLEGILDQWEHIPAPDREREVLIEMERIAKRRRRL